MIVQIFRVLSQIAQMVTHLKMLIFLWAHVCVRVMRKFEVNTFL